jgi:hypothetical protein
MVVAKGLHLFSNREVAGTSKMCRKIIITTTTTPHSKKSHWVVVVALRLTMLQQ